ncbi:hypothetical protein [Parvibacter caecicola]|nr:hypothetical protein [Parvibacter caecicola]
MYVSWMELFTLCLVIVAVLDLPPASGSSSARAAMKKPPRIEDGSSSH